MVNQARSLKRQVPVYYVRSSHVECMFLATLCQLLYMGTVRVKMPFLGLTMLTHFQNIWEPAPNKLAFWLTELYCVTKTCQTKMVAWRQTFDKTVCRVNRNLMSSRFSWKVIVKITQYFANRERWFPARQWSAFYGFIALFYITRSLSLSLSRTSECMDAISFSPS